jgi:hypothetical protein
LNFRRLGNAHGTNETKEDAVDLSRLQSVYAHDGPFATVYLEGRGPTADAGEQIRLRWRELREQLASAGATATALDVLENEFGADASGEQHANGRVLVATDSGVLLNEHWDAALGGGDAAHWTVVPELGPYARETARSVRLLVVLCDSHGAQLRYEVVAEQHTPHELSTVHVTGGGIGGVHKPRGGGVSHKHIQRRAGETVVRNAKDIVENTRKAAARFRPRAIVLAGEVQARTAIRHQLTDDIDDLVIDIERGSAEHGSDGLLDDQLLAIASDQAADIGKHYTDQLHAGLPHGHAVQGHQQVAKAAELGAVQTLLLEPSEPASREAFLLKVCAQTSSTLELVTEGSALQDGVAALLRFPLPQ